MGPGGPIFANVPVTGESLYLSTPSTGTTLYQMMGTVSGIIPSDCRNLHFWKTTNGTSPLEPLYYWQCIPWNIPEKPVDNCWRRNVVVPTPDWLSQATYIKNITVNGKQVAVYNGKGQNHHGFITGSGGEIWTAFVNNDWSLSRFEASNLHDTPYMRSYVQKFTSWNQSVFHSEYYFPYLKSQPLSRCRSNEKEFASRDSSYPLSI